MPDTVLREALDRATDTVAAAVGRGVLGDAGRLIASQLGPGPYRVIADENTWEAAGQATSESLNAAGARTLEPLVFPC